MRWHFLTNVIFITSGLMISLVGLLMTALNRYLEQWSRRFFLVFFIMLTLYDVSALLFETSIEMLGMGWAGLSQLLLFCQSLFSSLLMPMLTLYLLHSAGDDWKRSPAMAVALVLWLFYFGLLMATQFSDAIYYITPDNAYRRGPLYQLLLVPPMLLMVLNLLVLYRRLGRYTAQQKLAFLLELTLPLVSMLIQMLYYGLVTIVIGTSIAAFCLFYTILREQVWIYVRQQEQIALQKADIMSLQMRPHFICNTLMSIYYLCKDDAEKAQQVILDFTTYLRRNFTAVAAEETVPFDDELEHTRAYLAVERVRFEDKLFVELDAPVTDFRLPPLTLQPIVENAVKHGVSPELKPMHISVRTRSVEGGVEVSVEDSGPGYAPTDDDEPHIALANIRSRLSIICGGTLEITAGEAGGTRVTLFLPVPPKPNVIK